MSRANVPIRRRVWGVIRLGGISRQASGSGCDDHEVRAKGVVWLGTRTGRFTEMRAFLRALTGVEPRIDEPGFAVFDLRSGDRLEIFGEEDEGHHWMTAPVAGFLVDNVEAARTELEGWGIEFIGPVHHADDGNSWSHFRAPDGHVYELTSQPEHPAHSA